MNAKAKPCKGTSTVSVKGCGKSTLFRKYGLCQSCLRDWYLNTEDGQEKLNKATLKVTQERRELEQVERREKEYRSLESLKRNVTNVVHKYIRLRDEGKPCISCGSDWRFNFQAGHLYKAELYSSLKYHEDNIHGQCQGCNLYRDGNESKYHENLPNRIGKMKYLRLTELAAKDKHMNFKWDREELNNMREYYKEKIKNLQNSKT